MGLVDLPAAVAASVQNLTPAADAKRAHVAVQVDPEATTLRADGARVQQIL